MFERLLANSEESEQYRWGGWCCWEWTGRIGYHAYGHMSIRVPERKTPRGHLAHRVMAETVLGRPLLLAETVDHACEIPWCINFMHFRLMTRSENSSDARARQLGKPRKNHPMMIDESLYSVDRFIRSLPVLRSSLLENQTCPF